MGGFGPWEESREASVYDALPGESLTLIIRIARRGIPAAGWRCVLQ